MKAIDLWNKMDMMQKVTVFNDDGTVAGSMFMCRDSYDTFTLYGTTGTRQSWTPKSVFESMFGGMDAELTVGVDAV